jgi:HEAT repeats
MSKAAEASVFGSLHDDDLLVLAFVARRRLVTMRDTRRATGVRAIPMLGAVRRLKQAGLVAVQGRMGARMLSASAPEAKAAVAEYVIRVLAAFHARGSGLRGFSVGRFQSLGARSGPPMLSPEWALKGITDISVLINVVRSGPHDERRLALLALAGNDAPEVTALLLEVVQDHDNEDLARDALHYLAKTRRGAAVETLRAVARTRNSILRAIAARELGTMGAAEAVEDLIALLDYPSLPVRLAAVQALGKIGHPRAVAPLCRRLNDPDLEVRAESRLALIKLGATEALAANPRRLRPLRGLDARRARHASGLEFGSSTRPGLINRILGPLQRRLDELAVDDSALEDEQEPLYQHGSKMDNGPSPLPWTRR